MKGVYSRAWLLEKEGKLREYKGGDSKVWEEAKYKSKKIEKVGYDREKGF